MRYEVYKDAAQEWRWRAIAINGNVVATSGEGYKNKLDCEAMIDQLKGISKKNKAKPCGFWCHLFKIFGW